MTPLLKAAVSRRVDLIGIGDSNQGHSGFGWDHGWQAVLSNRYPMYATGWLGQGPTTIGYGYVCLGGLATTGAPPELDLYFDADRSVILPRYAWHPSGATTARVDFALEGWVPLDAGAALVLRRQIGLFPAGSYPATGSYREFVRRVDPYATLLTTPPISTATDGVGGAVLIDTLETGWAPVLAPDLQRRGVRLEWFSGRPGLADVAGPFFVGLSCVENADADAGFSYTTLVYAGGKSLRDMAYALQETRAQPMLINLFHRIRARQSQPDKIVMFTINSGLNDRNETDISVGPNPTLPGKSPDAFEDNAHAVVASVLSAWVAAGGSESEVYFLFTGSHPVEEADEKGEFPESEQLLREYRRRFADVAIQIPRSVAVVLDLLTSPSEMLANAWYFSVSDKAHLSADGFESLSAMQLTSIESIAGCWADLKVDRRIDVEDLYEFFSAPVDLNLDGSSTNGDAACLIRAVRWTEVADIPL